MDVVPLTGGTATGIHDIVQVGLNATGDEFGELESSLNLLHAPYSLCARLRQPVPLLHMPPTAGSAGHPAKLDGIAHPLRAGWEPSSQMPLPCSPGVAKVLFTAMLQKSDAPFHALLKAQWIFHRG